MLRIESHWFVDYTCGDFEFAFEQVEGECLDDIPSLLLEQIKSYTTYVCRTILGDLISNIEACCRLFELYEDADTLATRLAEIARDVSEIDASIPDVERYMQVMCDDEMPTTWTKHNVEETVWLVKDLFYDSFCDNIGAANGIVLVMVNSPATIKEFIDRYDDTIERIGSISWDWLLNTATALGAEIEYDYEDTSYTNDYIRLIKKEALNALQAGETE